MKLETLTTLAGVNLSFLETNTSSSNDTWSAYLKKKIHIEIIFPLKGQANHSTVISPNKFYIIVNIS